MTTRPAIPTVDPAKKITQYPDPPPDELTAYYAVNQPGYPPSRLSPNAPVTPPQPLQSAALCD